MADKRKYNSHLNSKGLETSVSEDQARHMAHNQGHDYFFVVKAHAGPKTVAEDGAEKVNLIPDLVELVPDQHIGKVRAFMDALYAQRPEIEGQAVLRGEGDGPNAADTAAQLDPQVWDGDTDAPLTEGRGPDFTGCDFPGCTLDSEHDGDHDVPEGD